MEPFLQYIGLSGLLAVVPVVMMFLTIRRDMNSANKERMARIQEETRWKTTVEHEIKDLKRSVQQLLELIKNGQ